MIGDYIALAQRVPYSRCRAFIDALREGVPFDEAVASASFVPRELPLLEPFRASEHTVEVGRGLELIYKALERDRGAELVWTGPVVPGVGNVRATFPVARSLVCSAREHIIIAGYVTQVDVLQRLGLYGALHRGVTATVLMDDVHAADPSILSLIAAGADVVDASPDTGGMAKFHAKAIVADAERALVTSANLTHLGQTRNVELGIVVTGDLAASAAALLERYARSLRRATSVVGQK
jgi:phosphatidylserine/phosphatidylglycerophosphate/cardiolipin synthase-like enzyme